MDDQNLKSSAIILCIVSMLFVMVFLPAAGVFAHEGDIVIDQDSLRTLHIQVAVLAAILLFILVLIALMTSENSGSMTKKIIFWSMVSTIAFPTFFFIGTTLYINFFSLTKGPVHWHADFKIIACGQETKLPRSKGVLSNKTGTNILHEHEDRRIHIEGVVTKENDVSLESFFAVQGGALTETSFTVPTNEGVLRYDNGDQCEDAGPGVWQVFLYTTDNGVARQQKLEHFAHYVPSPHTNVPPGDCIIFEFGPAKNRTDALCGSYQIKVNQNKLKIL